MINMSGLYAFIDGSSSIDFRLVEIERVNFE